MSVQSEIESMLRLEYGCRCCWFSNLPEPNCIRCKGTGTVPTELGREVLAFLKRHGKDLE